MEDKNGSEAYVPLEWHRIREIIMQLCWRASVFACSFLRFEQIFGESSELPECVSRKMITRRVRSIDPRRISSRPSSLRGILTILWTNVKESQNGNETYVRVRVEDSRCRVHVQYGIDFAWHSDCVRTISPYFPIRVSIKIHERS